MPDEKTMKAVLDIHTSLDDRPYKAIEEIARAAQPLAETLRAIKENSDVGQLQKTLRAIEESSGTARMRETMRFLEENSSLKRMLESVSLHQELARTALGPMWELRQAEFVNDFETPARIN